MTRGVSEAGVVRGHLSLQVKHRDELAKAEEKGIPLFLKKNTNFILSLVIKPFPGGATPSLTVVAAGSVSAATCSHAGNDEG